MLLYPDMTIPPNKKEQHFHVVTAIASAKKIVF